ncbi:MAG: PQQ-binding-like beta-propeller repeat protein [Planctomycetales bacterium]|nr:PQQ-binding-like beta-propeller repeat protein [Planctomycetales bacterium]
MIWTSARSALCWCFFLGIAGQASADWIARNGNASQTGHVATSFDPNLLQLDWAASLQTRYPVAVADGSVVVSTGSAIYSLDADTGSVQWEVSGASFREPTIAEGNVFVPTGAHSSSCGVTCSEKTYLRSYAADDGAFRFRSAFSSQWSKGWGPVPYAGRVYMNGGYYGGIYSFTTSGASQFSGLAQYSDWAPAIDDDYVYAYVAGYLQVLDRHTLSQVKFIANPDYSWRGYSMNTIPVVTEDGDVLVRYGGRLMSFDIDNEQVRWSRAANFSGQPVYNEGVVYGVEAGAMSAIDKDTGESIWAWELPSESLTDWMLLTDSHLFVQSTSTTYALGLESRRAEWSYPATGLLAFDAGRLYLAGEQILAFSIVPEPAAVSMALLGMTVWLPRRRNRSLE